MRGIIRFFKAIDDFLTASVNYFDYRVKTGKIVGDINTLSKQNNENLQKHTTTALKKASKSTLYQKLSGICTFFWNGLMQIGLFANIATLLGDGLHITIKYYAEIFIIFALTFPALALLINFFESSIITFFVFFFPILFFISTCFAALYYCIEKRTNGEKISLWRSFAQEMKQIFRLGTHVFIHVAIILECFIGLFILSLFLSYIFDTIGIPWSNSFLYWFFVVFVGLLINLGVTLITIIMHQAFFIILFEKKTIQEAFAKGWQLVKISPFLFFFFYLLLVMYSGVFIYSAAIYYLYGGVAVSVFFFVTLSLFLGFLLRRKVIKKAPIGNTPKKYNFIFSIIGTFGIINYVLVAVLLTTHYDTLTLTAQKMRDKLLLSQQLKTYTNALYRYTIEYPPAWGVYDNRAEAVRFYDNYTGTVSGGVWLDVVISPFSEGMFEKLYAVRPGVVNFYDNSQDITTKISNLSIQGYPGVSYTFFKADVPYSQYQTHYLIHKNDLQYDLAFTTLASGADPSDSDMFERIISSFRFMH